MSGIPVEKRPDHWIVQGEGVSSGRLYEHIEKDPNIKEIRRIAHDVVVLSMPAERAEKLGNEFGKHLVIERDADLTSARRSDV